MYLYHRAVQSQFVRFAQQGRYLPGISAQMARVQQHRYVRSSQTNRVRHAPTGLMVAAAMNGHHLHTRFLQPLYIAEPQLRIGIYRVFDENTFQICNLQSAICNRICNRLYCHRISTCACTYPEIVNTRLQRLAHMFRRSYFGGNRHTQLGFYLLEPRERLVTCTLKRVRTRTRFPCTCAVDKRSFTAHLFDLACGE